MKPWQRPAALLPVRIRPIQAETVVSFLFRLADANALSRPTTLLRALGEPVGAAPTYSWIDRHEITLNNAAARRLEIFTGIPVAGLGKALPALAATSPGPAPATPTFRGHRSIRLRDQCEECVARLPGRPRVRVHDTSVPEICRRHHRWVRITHTRPRQIDLSGTGAVLRAHRRLNRLCGATGDRDWTMQQLAEAEYVAREWFRSSRNHLFQHLHTR